MSGIFHEGHWYGNTDMVCRRCGRPVYQSDHSEYSYQCFCCDEDLYSFEVEEQDGLYLPKVAVARPVNGITLNEGMEFLLDENKETRVFNNQPEAEVFLLANGFTSDDLVFLYFVEVDDNEMRTDNRKGRLCSDTEGEQAAAIRCGERTE